MIELYTTASLNNQLPFDNKNPVLDAEMTAKEVTFIANKCKNDKIPGPDKISYEFYKKTPWKLAGLSGWSFQQNYAQSMCIYIQIYIQSTFSNILKLWNYLWLFYIEIINNPTESFLYIFCN